MGLGTMLIRADASPEIGTGHVMRCLALAQAWQDAGGNVVFVMADSTVAIRTRLRNEHCQCISISALPGSAEDADCTMGYALSNHAEWIVIDGYTLGAQYQQQVKKQRHKLLCIDDEGLLDQYAADLILNQNVTATEKLYRNRLQRTKLLLGTRFCLLRREFSRWRQWRKEIPIVGRRVLVLLGGSTPEETGMRVIESLALVDVDGFRATFVIGGSTPHAASLQRHSSRFSRKVTLVKDVSDLSPLMSQADAAVSAAGSTCWELCLFRLPSILLDLAPNQAPVALELHRSGAALYGGNGSNIEPVKLANALRSLLRSREMRQSLSQRAGELVDGRGAERVVSVMRHFEQEYAPIRPEMAYQ